MISCLSIRNVVYRWTCLWNIYHITSMWPFANKIKKNTLLISDIVKTILFVCETYSLIAVLIFYCGGYTFLVLATVPGYQENSGTQQVRGRVRTGPWFHFTVRTTLAAIKYLNFCHIVTWSIREICRLMPLFISHSQICDRINFLWVALKSSRISRQNARVSIATQWLLIRLEIGEWEMKEGIKQHISCIYYVVIRCELQYLIGVRNVDFWGVGCVWKPVAMVRFRVRTGPGTAQGVWTRW